MKFPVDMLNQWVGVLASQPDTPEEFMAWVTGPVKKFFPFERVLMGHGEEVAGQIQVTHVLADGHTPEYLQHIGATFTLAARGAMQWWLRNRAPILLDVASPPPYATAYEWREVRDFGLGRIAAHGILNAKTNAGSYFSFAGIPVPLTDWHRAALELMAPVLNSHFLAHIAVQRRSVMARLDGLTPRQKDIARLLARGASDKAIAKDLALAEKTVRNQLRAIYATTGTRTRGELIALLH